MFELPAGSIARHRFAARMEAARIAHNTGAIVVSRSETARGVLQGTQISPHRAHLHALCTSRGTVACRRGRSRETLGASPSQSPGARRRARENGPRDARGPRTSFVDAE